MVSKANYKDFLTNKKYHMLTEEEFDSIVDYCNFSLAMPETHGDNVVLTIKLDAPLPFNIFKKLKDLNIPRFKVVIESNTPSNDFTFLNEYIQYFLVTVHPDLYSLKDLLSKQNVSATDKKLYIKYVNEGEKKQIQELEKELLLYLNRLDFDLTSAEYVVDQEKLLLQIEAENAKKKAMYEAAKAIVDKKENPLDKYEHNFRVKGPFTNIEKLMARTDVEDRFREKVKITGQIFECNHKDIHAKEAKMYEFGIYDNFMGAIKVKYYCHLHPVEKKYKNQRPEMPKVYMESFKTGEWISAEIELIKSQYTGNEIQGWIVRMCHASTPEEFIVRDEAKNKRVELLVHSNLTSYDGLNEPLSIYKFAAGLGHNALAIVDRENIQAFPDIVNYASKINIKHLYGCEMELIEEMIPICLNPHGQDLLKSKYVVFDIETTGLYPEYEDMIEFGAITWENGQKTSSIDFFVKPTKPLSNVAINMSHITEEMVKDAISQKQALLKIKEYIGDAILVAHNGIRFDLTFLNKLCERYGVEPINNTLIDTLEISHSINKKFARHNLGTLTRKLKIDYNEAIAHRADKDAEYLLAVWQWMLKHINTTYGIKNADEINSVLQNDTIKSNRHGYYVDIYAKNQKGIKALYKIVTKASTDQIYIRSEEASKQIGTPKIFWSNLEEYRQDLIICPHPMDGCIWDSALMDREEVFEAKMKKFDYIFVAPWKNYEHLVYREEITKNNVKKTISKIIETANKLNIKVCAVSDAHYLMPYEHQFYEIYVYTPQLGSKPHSLYRREKTFVPEYHFMTTNEMLDAFAFLKDEKLINDIVINNTNYFADSIEETKPLKKLLPNPKGIPKYPWSPKIEGSEKFLTDLVWSNAKNIYTENIPEDVKARIEKELNAIISNHYAVIYWISHLLVKQSNEDGYLVGSRGSVGSSIVAYLSNISEVNPLPPHYLCKKCHHYEPYEDVTVDGFDLPPKKCPVCGEEMFRDGHNIPFESFLGQDCDKIPDIDLNFSGEYQAKAHSFIKKMFDDKHAFRAGTISTVAAKTAYGYVKKFYEEHKGGINLSSTLTSAIASKCQGVKKTTGQHPGGIVVVPLEMDIEDFCPAQFPSNDKSSDWMTTHFDYHQMNETLLKFDILGHDEPTILNHLERETGIDPRTIPYFDSKVIELFFDSGSLGIIDDSYDKTQVGTFALPEFGTAMTRKIVLETKPQGVGDLVKISGLSHGTGVWKGNAQDLIKKGLKINQVICCREDIIDFLTKCGVSFAVAFDATEKVRKKKGLPEAYELDMIKHNVPKYYIDALKKIEYLFPKAHATAYVIDAIRTGWYKVYYPVQFYAVWMSIRSDKAFDIETILKGRSAIEARLKDIKSKEMSRDSELKEKDLELVPILEVALEMLARGIKMEKLDINKSLAMDFIPTNHNTIIPPFVSIDGLGAEAAKSIVAARKERPFTSISDLQERTKLSTTVIGKLKDLNVLDTLPDDEQMKLF